MAAKRAHKTGKMGKTWNEGKRGAEIGAGGPDSPWKGNGGAGHNQGRRPGDLNTSTYEAGSRLSQFRKLLTDKLSLENFASLVIRYALEGSAPHAAIYRDCVVGRPKQSVELEANPEAPALGGFRCFLSDGRSLSSAPVPLPGEAPPRS